MKTLKEIRRSLNLSEAETGFYINRTRYTYRNIELGKSPIYNFQLERLASIFGIDVEDIDTSELNYREMKKPYTLSGLRKAGVIQAHNIVYICEPTTARRAFNQKLYDLENGKAKIYISELEQILKNTGITIDDLDTSKLWIVDYLDSRSDSMNGNYKIRLVDLL